MSDWGGATQKLRKTTYNMPLKYFQEVSKMEEVFKQCYAVLMLLSFQNVACPDEQCRTSGEAGLLLCLTLDPVG